MIDKTSLTLKPGEYRNQVTKKTQICIHFTAGFTAAGALSTWRRTPSRDGTAYVIERNGTIYETFDPDNWAVHIYRHKDSEPPVYYHLEKSSIGIEIVNVGPLTLGVREDDKDVLYTYTKKRYCTLAETEKYVAGEFRSKFYWQSFTEDQYISVKLLLDQLSSRFDIPIQNSPVGNRLDFWPLDKLSTYVGATSHNNYRRDKYDIGPGFIWSKVGLTDKGV